MRIAWTGSRDFSATNQQGPKPLTRHEAARVSLDVVTRLIALGSLIDGPTVEIGQGACSGVDEIVLATAIELRDTHGLSVRVVSFIADKEPTWDMFRAPRYLIAKSDEVMDGMKYLERDARMAQWADAVRAFPLVAFERSLDGVIVVGRGAGTAFTVRAAEGLDKVEAIMPLRTRR
jgi:hypothetical protein